MTRRVLPLALIGLLVTFVLAGGAAIAQGQVPAGDQPATDIVEEILIPADAFARMRHTPLNIHLPVWTIWFTVSDI